MKDRTHNVLFYSYAVPGIDGIYLKEGLTVAAETMDLSLLKKLLCAIGITDEED